MKPDDSETFLFFDTDRTSYSGVWAGRHDTTIGSGVFKVVVERKRVDGLVCERAQATFG